MEVGLEYRAECVFIRQCEYFSCFVHGVWVQRIVNIIPNFIYKAKRSLVNESFAPWVLKDQELSYLDLASKFLEFQEKFYVRPRRSTNFRRSKNYGSVFLFCHSFGFIGIIFVGKTENSCHQEVSPVQLPLTPSLRKEEEKKKKRSREALIHIGTSQRR